MPSNIETIEEPIRIDETSRSTLHQSLADRLGGLLNQRIVEAENPPLSTAECQETTEKRRYGRTVGRFLGAAALGGGIYLEVSGMVGLGTALLVVDGLFVAGPLNEARGNRKNRRQQPQL